MPRSKITESWTEESRATPTDPAAGCGLFGREEELCRVSPRPNSLSIPSAMESW